MCLSATFAAEAAWGADGKVRGQEGAGGGGSEHGAGHKHPAVGAGAAPSTGLPSSTSTAACLPRLRLCVGPIAF